MDNFSFRMHLKILALGGVITWEALARHLLETLSEDECEMIVCEGLRLCSHCPDRDTCPDSSVAASN